MDEDLKKIKQLINSKNNQNLYMGFYMLKNYKKYDKGEFKEVFKLMFIQTKKVFKLNIENEVCIYFRVYKPPNYRYQTPTPDVFSYNIKIGKTTNFKKKQIPIEFYEGIQNKCFTQILNYIESFLQTDFK